MAELTDKLHGYCTQRRQLMPIAKQTAIVYCILGQLEESNALPSHNWEQFEGLFKKVLVSFINEHPTFSKDITNEAVHSAVDYINHAILKESIQ